MNQTVAIIGAGPAGMAAAHSLANLGVSAHVFEASSQVGGMARSFELWGQIVDLGPHRFFSADARVNRLWLEVVGDQYRMVDRLTRIYYGGDFFHYPLNAMNVLATLGTIEASRCALSFLQQKLRRQGSAQSFEQWVQSRFGDRLYRIFFKSYSEKVWGVPCDQLDAEFAAQRIRKLSLFEAVRNSIANVQGRRHPTLVDRFAYPLGGTGSVYQAMAESLRERGGRLLLDSPVRRVMPADKHQIELASGEVHSFDHVISSMPLTHLVRALPDAPAKVINAAAELRFRNTILVYLRISGARVFSDQWVYVHAPELDIGRITNYRNWVPELCGDSPDTIISVELWCHPADEKWQQPDQWLVDRATADLRQTGLIDERTITDSYVVRVPNCYPIYDLDYRTHLSVLQDYLATIPGLQVIGRAGAFKYNNQDHSLLMGHLAAENIALDRCHDLWGVNTDDSYQEEAIIDETGLVPVPS